MATLKETKMASEKRRIAKLNQKFGSSKEEVRKAKLNRKFDNTAEEKRKAKLNRKFDTGSRTKVREAKLNRKFDNTAKEKRVAKLARKFDTPEKNIRKAKNARLNAKFETSPKKSVFSKIKETLGFGPKTYDGSKPKPRRTSKGSGGRRNFAGGVSASNRQKSMRMKAGGSVTKCKRDGIAQRGRTKGRIV